MRATDVLAIGECLGLLVAERPGKLAHIRGMRLGFGGAEGNVAIGVARLGGAASWAGRVGEDGLGELITRELRAEGVKVHATVDTGATTALMIKERPRPGTSRLTYYRSSQAGSRLQPADIPASLVESARILHVTGISAGLSERTLETVHAAINRAQAANVLVSFDVNHRSSLWRGSDEERSGRDARSAYRELAVRADIVFAGNDEAELLTGETAPLAQLDAIRALGAGCAVVKLGAKGALADLNGERIERAALQVDAVDTVGAGDAFVAGWLAETARGASLAERMDTAIACGAFACMAEGDWESAPTRADLASLYAPAADPVLR